MQSNKGDTQLKRSRRWNRRTELLLVKLNRTTMTKRTVCSDSGVRRSYSEGWNRAESTKAVPSRCPVEPLVEGVAAEDVRQGLNACSWWLWLESPLRDGKKLGGFERWAPRAGLLGWVRQMLHFVYHFVVLLDQNSIILSKIGLFCWKTWNIIYNKFINLIIYYLY